MFYERLLFLEIGGEFRTIMPNNPQHVFDIYLHRAINTSLLKNNNLTSWDITIRKTGLDSLGTCDHKNQIISVSPTALHLMEFQQIRNLIIHEVAHALTPYCGHNDVWREKCIELGGTGKVHWNIIDVNCIDFKNQLYKVKISD